MPYKGSRATHKKNCMLGQLQKHKKMVSEMEVKLSDLKKELNDKQLEIDQRIKEAEELDARLKLVSADINRKKRKLDHKRCILNDIQSETEHAFQAIRKEKRKSVLSISACLEKKRKMNPSGESIPSRSKSIRRKETMDACMKIHGGTALNKDPVLFGMLDTLTSQFKSKILTDKILDSKEYLKNSIEKKVLNRWSKDYYLSRENKLRSLNSYYCHNVLGKRKYLSLRQANKQPAFGNSKLPNFVSYKVLSKEIESIDIGKLNKINGQEKIGLFRPPAEYILHLASFYMKVNVFREDKLKTFPAIPKKDPDSFLFALAIGGDGAPAVGMTILVSFLNVGERLPSSKEQFLLFGGNVEENSDTVEKFLSLLVKDLKYLESKVFEVENATKKVKVEFKITELPNDMKMLPFLAGELSNSAAYFTTFANVNQSKANDYKNLFGISSQHS